MKITFISDTHNLHYQITKDLPGGDILIHAGDVSGRGREMEIDSFLLWFDGIQGYKQKIFIAGNHDFFFDDDYRAYTAYGAERHKIKPQNKSDINNKLIQFSSITYLQESSINVMGINIFGSPIQPWFHDWAFNRQRGEDIKQHWDLIPENTDILITHGPAYGKLDLVKGRTDKLGCEDLMEKIDIIKPKIHVWGHIHSGYGYCFNENTHFINASVLDEQYSYTQKPFNVEWDKETNQIQFI